MSIRKYISKQDVLAALVLLIFPLILFAPVTLGDSTLLPVDNRFTFEPYATYADDFGITTPQNHLLSDLILQNYIWKDFLRQAIAEREVPLWNPYIFAGQPFLANGQHSALYPFSNLFYTLPLPKAYGWFTVLHFWLAGLFTYIFLRTLALPRRAALLGGLVFSLSTFLITRVVFTMVIAAAVWLPAVLAIIEIVIRKQASKGTGSYSPVPYLMLGSVAVGLNVLAGHIEMTYYLLLVSAFYATFRLFFLWRQQRTLKPALRLTAWLWVMMAVGLGLGAVQFIPFYEIGVANFREGAASLAQVREWALPIRQAISFVIPHFFGSSAHHEYFDLLTRQWQSFGLNAYGEINPLCPNCATWDIKTSVEAGAYVGLFPLILAGFAVMRLFRRKKTAQEQDYAQSTVIFAVLAGLALLFAFGTPLYALLYYGLPGWNQLHSPFRWIYPFTLSLAVLTGLGFAQLERSRLSISLAHLLGWGGLLGTIATLIVFAVPEPFVPLGQFVIDRSGLAQNAFADGGQFLSYQWPHALHLFAVLGLSGLALRLLTPRRPSEPRRSLVFGLTVLIVGVDLLIAGWSFNPATDPALLDFTPPAVEWLQAQQEDDPFFRLTSFDSPSGRGNKILNANTAMGAELFDVRGYDSIILGQYHQFMQLIQPNNDGLYNRVGPVYAPGYTALDSALLDLLGVRYVLTIEDIPNAGYALVYDDEIKIYENLDVLPRAFLVADTEIAPADLNFALRSLNPRETVILDGEQLKPGLDLTEEAAHSPLDSAGVAIVSYERNTVELEAHVAAEAGRWLVLADTYFNGWRAYAHPLGDETAAEQEVTIHRANENFRAVYLPEGSWAVRFYYAPMSFRIGLYVSFLAGVLLIFLLALWSWGRLYRESETDSPIKRIAKNSLVPMVMALSNRLIDFAFALLMLRILQPEGAGRYAFAVAFISMAEIITRYGLGTLVTRDVAGDRSRSNRYLSNVSILRLYLWLAALPFMGAILAMYVIFGSTTNDVVITVAIFAFGTLFSNLSDGLTAIFYAHEKAEYPAAIASVTTLTRVSLGALVLLLGWGIIGLAVASVAANLVAFAALSLILLQKIFRPTLETDSGLQREMMAESLPLMLNHMLSTIFFRIDVFILKPTWGDAQVGYYNAAYKYIDGINVIPQYFTLAIFPLMSKFATDSQESLVRAYLLSLRLLLILALPIAVGTPFVAHELILFLAGESYLPDSTIVLQLLIWFLPFSFINQVTQYVLIAINQQRALTKAFIIGVGFNILANLIFIPLYGYRAAAVTTILSEWALLIPFYRLVRTHLCTVPWLDVVWRPAVAAAAMGGALWLVGDINFGLTVLLGGVVYGVMLPLLGGLNQQDMPVIWRAIPWERLRAYLPGR